MDFIRRELGLTKRVPEPSFLLSKCSVNIKIITALVLKDGTDFSLIGSNVLTVKSLGNAPYQFHLSTVIQILSSGFIQFLSFQDVFQAHNSCGSTDSVPIPTNISFNLSRVGVAVLEISNLSVKRIVRRLW